MPASTPCERPISHTTCFTNSCATSRASCSGANSPPMYGTTRPSSAVTSSACWFVGLRNVATRPASSSGDCRTRVCCPRLLPRSAATSSAAWILLVATSEPSPPAMVARVLTGTLSRTGAVPMAVQPRTTTTS